MKLVQRIPQVFPVQVGVNFCGGNAFMPQHFLHGPQVGAAFYQVRSKGMPEGMG